MLVRRYVQERLIYRLSVSPESRSFCLKGGSLLFIYKGSDLFRPTEDMDSNGFDGGSGVHKFERSLKGAVN